MHLSPGTELGPYKIVSLLGVGGMGEVYRARDDRIRRNVAIKVIRGMPASGDDATRRFAFEARAAGQLIHPNVVTVFDVGTYQGAPYLVTELVNGETLRATIRHGPIPPQRAAEYGAQIAEGLAAAHDKNVVHRDLKPNNLFLTPAGCVKILDFGLAKLVESASASTPSGDHATTRTASEALGTIAGTYGYMSPEQIRGERLDHRTDIFSLGIVLCEMLTGRNPFGRSSSVETMSATLAEDAALDLPKGVPPALEAIIRRCLDKKPANRFQSAHDLAFALRTLPGLPVPASRGAASPDGGKRRRPLLAIVGVLAAAALVSAAFFTGRFTLHTTLPGYQQLTFRRGLVLSARFAPDGHTVVYGAAWQRGPVELYSVRPDSPESRPLDLPSADILAISSTGEMAILLGRRHVVGFDTRGTLARVSLGGGAPRELLTDVDDADWSPDGRALAVAHVVSGKYRLEYPIGQVLYESGGRLSHLRVSRDGHLVAFLDHPNEGDDRGTVCVIGADKQLKRLTRSFASTNGLDWSADGRELWFTASESNPYCKLYATDMTGRTRLVARSLGRLALQDIHPGGSVLLTEAQFRVAMAHRRKVGEQDTDLSWLDASVVNDVSADARSVLFEEEGAGAGTGTGALYTRTLEQSAAVRLGEGSLGAFSPDGAWVAALVQGERPTLTLLPTGAGSPIRLTAGAIADCESVAWFPDGKHILLSGSEPGHDVRLYTLAVSGGPPKAISSEGVRTNIYSKPVSPDGSRIAALDRAGNLVLQPAEGGPPRPVPGAANGDVPIRWNVRGTGLYVYRKNELPARVYMLDVVRGRKELIGFITPADSAGVTGIASLLLAPEGDDFLYSYSQTLSNLYLGGPFK